MKNINKSIVVSVIVPVYNGEAVINRCITALQNQDYPREKYEIIFVDNLSIDKTTHILKMYKAQIYRAKKIGPSAARNVGIKHAHGEILIFIDADCIAHPQLISKHVEAHNYFDNADPLVKIIGGGIGGINKNFWSLWDDIFSWYRFHPQLKERSEYWYFPTANISVKREVFNKVGVFNENMRYGEDVTFCINAQQKGYKLYFKPEAAVSHINRKTFREIINHLKEWTEGNLLLIKMDISPPKPPDCSLRYFVLCCSRSKRMYGLFFIPFFLLYGIWFMVIEKIHRRKYRIIKKHTINCD